MVKKIMITYNKPMKLRKQKKDKNGIVKYDNEGFVEVDEHTKTSYNPKIALKFDSNKNEMIIASPHCLSNEVFEIIKWFKGATVKEVISKKNKQGHLLGRFKVIVFCYEQGWKTGKKRMIKEKNIKGNKWNIQFNANLGRAIN